LSDGIDGIQKERSVTNNFHKWKLLKSRKSYKTIHEIPQSRFPQCNNVGLSLRLNECSVGETESPNITNHQNPIPDVHISDVRE